MLYARGYALVSEGLVVVSAGDSAPTAQPGPPVLRLWDDALARLVEDPEDYPLADPQNAKRSFPAPRAVSSPVAIAVIYVLADGDAERIEELRGAESAVALIGNLYLQGRLSQHEVSAALGLCARIADSVRVCRLHRRKTVDLIDRILNLIETDMASSGSR